MTTKPLPADVATIRAAIMDTLDAGDKRSGSSWLFFLNESEEATSTRVRFADAVVARIAQFQQPPFVEREEKQRMEWSRQWPLVNGYYWRRINHRDPPSLVRIVGDTCRFTDGSSEGRHECYEFLGPITVEQAEQSEVTKS